MKQPVARGLFDIIEQEEAREAIAAGAECKHPVEIPTETIWPGENFYRLTMTCTVCNRIRGRFPGEPKEKR